MSLRDILFRRQRNEAVRTVTQPLPETATADLYCTSDTDDSLWKQVKKLEESRDRGSRMVGPFRY